MLQLPALDPEERACLQSLLPGSPLAALAERLRKRLIASLGVAVTVWESPSTAAPETISGDEPLIRIEPELAAAWLAVRLGGKCGTAGLQIRDASLAEPFRMLIGRALAETVINLGKASWPQAMRLRVAIGRQQGVVDIFWNSEHAMPWARRAIRERV
jgi:hypothetical protein